jgi:hypothetical protein
MIRVTSIQWQSAAEPGAAGPTPRRVVQRPDLVGDVAGLLLGQIHDGVGLGQLRVQGLQHRALGGRGLRGGRRPRERAGRSDDGVQAASAIVDERGRGTQLLIQRGVGVRVAGQGARGLTNELLVPIDELT